jgi:hypothetical protein
VNMWQDEPEHVASSFARVQRRHPGRFLLGVGAGHRGGHPAVRPAVPGARPLRGRAPGRGRLPRQPGAGLPGPEGTRPGQGPRRRRHPLSRPARAHPPGAGRARACFKSWLSSWM